MPINKNPIFIVIFLPDGWPCPPEEQLIQNETCNTHACATYSWLATPWGPCEPRRQDFLPATNYTDLLVSHGLEFGGNFCKE